MTSVRGANPELLLLSNGMRVVHQRLPYSRMVHCGVLVNVGSRHERKEENGIAHFLEHAVFKGTTHRKPYHILSRMENVGGELDAFTSRDRTGFTASAPSRYAERALALITDMLFQPTFPSKEIQKERQVIHEELEMYADSPEESLFDDLHSLMYPDQPLGRNILGEPSTLAALDVHHLKQFHQEYYKPENMVLAMVGNITAHRAQKLIYQYLEPLASSGSTYNGSVSAVTGRPFSHTVSKDFQQAYGILAAKVPGRNSEQRHAIQVLNALLGGSDMSARLNLRLREQYGYVYQVDTAYLPYEDTGLFTIDFSTDWRYYHRSVSLIQKELKQICHQEPGKIQLNRAKRQLLGQASMQEENPANLLMTQLNTVMNHGKPYHYHRVAKHINKITAPEISAIACESLTPDKVSWLTYQPANG